VRLAIEDANEMVPILTEKVRTKLA